MICPNGFRFLNEFNERILEGKTEEENVILTTFAGNQEEGFSLTAEEVVELAAALVSLAEEIYKNRPEPEVAFQPLPEPEPNLDMDELLRRLRS
jgi:hypothetical protein